MGFWSKRKTLRTCQQCVTSNLVRCCFLFRVSLKTNKQTIHLSVSSVHYNVFARHIFRLTRRKTHKDLMHYAKTRSSSLSCKSVDTRCVHKARRRESWRWCFSGERRESASCRRNRGLPRARGVEAAADYFRSSAAEIRRQERPTDRSGSSSGGGGGGANKVDQQLGLMLNDGRRTAR